MSEITLRGASRVLRAIARNLLLLGAAARDGCVALSDDDLAAIALWWTDGGLAGATTLQASPDALKHGAGVATARGGSWYPGNVRNVMSRAER